VCRTTYEAESKQPGRTGCLRGPGPARRNTQWNLGARAVRQRLRVTRRVARPDDAGLKTRNCSTSWIVGSPNVNPLLPWGISDYPTMPEDYQKTFAVLKACPCDIFLGSHGAYFGCRRKYARFKRAYATAL